MHIVTVLCIFYTFIHDLMYKSKFYAYFFGGKLEFMGIASLVKGRGTVVDGGGILLIFARNPLATSWPSPL